MTRDPQPDRNDIEARVTFHYVGFRGYPVLFASSGVTLLALLGVGFARGRDPR